MCRKFKKRHRKDLTAEEIESIVADTEKPFKLIKDVALEYKISPQLVGVLIRESKNGSGKLEALRERMRVQELKK